MDPCDRRNLRSRRDVARQHLEDFTLQGPLNRAQAVALLADVLLASEIGRDKQVVRRGWSNVNE
jgi:hypothetical protein